jgi:hypothetical protein
VVDVSFRRNLQGYSCGSAVRGYNLAFEVRDYNFDSPVQGYNLGSVVRGYNCDSAVPNCCADSRRIRGRPDGSQAHAHWIRSGVTAQPKTVEALA